MPSREPTRWAGGSQLRLLVGLGVVGLAGSLGLIAIDAAFGRWAPRAIAREVPWGLFPLFGGLILLVGGAEHARRFVPIEQFVLATASFGAVRPPTLGLGSAVLANVINNRPVALVTASSLGIVQPEAARANLAAGAIVGVNLRPNLTTIGSLSTMLWLLLLRRQGIDVSVVSYLRVGVVVMVPALLAAAAALWLAVR